MLDKMKQCPVLDDGSHIMFSTTMKRIEDLQQNNRKQSPIKANFKKKLLNTFESILCQRILLHVQVPSLSFTILVKKSMNNIFWLKFHEKLLQLIVIFSIWEPQGVSIHTAKIVFYQIIHMFNTIQSLWTGWLFVV